MQFSPKEPRGGHRNWFFLGYLLLLLFAAVSCRKEEPSTVVQPPGQRSVNEVIQEAERLFAGREDLSKVRQAIFELKQARAIEPSSYDVAWRLAKFDYCLGVHSQDTSEQDKAFREGIEAGRLAVKLQDNKPDGHFWLGANYGGRAEISVLAGIVSIEDIKTEMQRVLQIDEGYQSGSAYMVLGQVYLATPRFMGGNAQEAVDYLEKGLRFAADNTPLHVRLAEAYLAVNRKDDARKQLAVALSIKPNPDYIPEHKHAVEQAHQLEEKLK